jgi:hypothetical protein
VAHGSSSSPPYISPTKKWVKYEHNNYFAWIRINSY